jgi:hypothetical protein
MLHALNRMMRLQQQSLILSSFLFPQQQTSASHAQNPTAIVHYQQPNVTLAWADDASLPMSSKSRQ